MMDFNLEEELKKLRVEPDKELEEKLLQELRNKKAEEEIQRQRRKRFPVKWVSAACSCVLVAAVGVSCYFALRRPAEEAHRYLGISDCDTRIIETEEVSSFVGENFAQAFSEFEMEQGVVYFSEGESYALQLKYSLNLDEEIKISSISVLVAVNEYFVFDMETEISENSVQEDMNGYTVYKVDTMTEDGRFYQSRYFKFNQKKFYFESYSIDETIVDGVLLKIFS